MSPRCASSSATAPNGPAQTCCRVSRAGWPRSIRRRQRLTTEPSVRIEVDVFERLAVFDVDQHGPESLAMMNRQPADALRRHRQSGTGLIQQRFALGMFLLELLDRLGAGPYLRELRFVGPVEAGPHVFLVAFHRLEHRVLLIRGRNRDGNEPR